MRETCEAISTILEEEQKEGSSLSRKVNSIIERDYRGKISLKDIGKELFVNSSYLSRVYKKRQGIQLLTLLIHIELKRQKKFSKQENIEFVKWGKWWGLKIRHILHMFFEI